MNLSAVVQLVQMKLMILLGGTRRLLKLDAIVVNIRSFLRVEHQHKSHDPTQLNNYEVSWFSIK